MIEARPKWGRGGIWAVQILGVLGTSHLLDRALVWIPGWSESRIAARLAESAALDPAQRIGEFLRDAVLTGTLEELFFRGLVFEIVRRVRGPGAAVVTSAVLFGLAHGDGHQAIAACLLGLQLGAIRLYEGLALAVIAHVVNNALAFWTASHPLSPSFPALGLALLFSIAACASLAWRARALARGEAESSWPLQTTTRSDDSAS